MSKYEKLDALFGKMRSMRPLNETELRRLRGEFTIEHTHDSTAIEGNTLTLRETALILGEGVTIAGKPLKDHLEAIGYRDAFEYIVELASRDTPLTERVIKDIHTLVLMNDRENRGIYRNIPVTIMGAVHTPPQPYLVPDQMEQLVSDYANMKERMHIIEAVAELHLRFEGVHPFIHGNGRTGRLILNFELIKAGLLPVNIKFADRRRYYDAFDAYYGDEHTSEPMMRMIEEYEISELERRIKILTRE